MARPVTKPEVGEPPPGAEAGYAEQLSSTVAETGAEAEARPTEQLASAVAVKGWRGTWKTPRAAWRWRRRRKRGEEAPSPPEEITDVGFYT